MSEINVYLSKIYKLDENNSNELHISDSSISEDDFNQLGRIGIRIHSISDAIIKTIFNNQDSILEAAEQISLWIGKKSIVRVLGAGRALIAATLPGNRLAHAGSFVSFMGGAVPMPNSIEGGGIIAASASGKTKVVLEAMEIAKNNNPDIKIIGIADKDAYEFAELCDIFIGINKPFLPVPDQLTALADREELIIAEILDSIVVLAGEKQGFSDEAWRKGHEDIGPTGPYSPKKKN